MPRVHLPDGRIVNFPDGMPEQEITAAIQQLSKPDETPAAPQKTGGGIVDALPTIAGTAFSLAGGSKALPTGMALSALGGAAGEGARQVIRSVQGQWDQVPDSIGGRLKAMGREAVGQGGLEGLGRGAARIVTPAAKALYGVAMRPAKALRLRYGTMPLINQGFADRVMPTMAGEVKAGKLVGQSKGVATKIAEDSPAQFDLSRVLQKATDEQAGRMQKDLMTGGITPPIDKAATQIGNVLDSNQGPVSAARLLELRRGADEIADPAFKAARMPGGAGRVPAGSEASVAKSMANAERQTLDDALGAPFKQANAQTRRRAGVQQMAKDAAERPNMLTNILAGGVGATGLYGEGDTGEAIKRALVFRLALSPSAQAGAALSAAPIAKYGPRVADIATGGGMKDVLVQYLLGGGQQ